MEKIKRIAALMLVDAVLINGALFGSLLIRFDSFQRIPAHYLQAYYNLALFFTLSYLVCFYFFRFYHRLWRYASVGELMAVAGAVTAGVGINFVFSWFSGEFGRLALPRGVFLLSWMLNIILIGGSRLIWRLYREYTNNYHHPTNKRGKPIMVVGAGDSGVLVAKELKRHYNSGVNIVGFVDDDLDKQKAMVLGLPVLGGRQAIPELVSKYRVEEIILAIPSAGGDIIREIVAICHETKAKLKILPGMFDLIEGNVTVSHIREVEVEDLLGREPVNLEMDGISQYLKGQVVLVTGAGGSIGSELCRQIARYAPKKLLLLDNCENSIFEMEQELRMSNPRLDMSLIVKDIRDRKAVELAFKLYRPQVVFHAAAHKHVPLMELNPEEAIKNNVMGTYFVAKAADVFGCKKFVLISTDKAVNPSSVMGASKRVAEMMIQHLNLSSKTNFVAVRFGNVLASRGSVIPLFKKQIANGGPVTVTHEAMVRYFMTICEAVQLVIQAGAMARGGEIFVLDMGKPIKIMDLAKTLIKLSGFEPGIDIKIAITGIRPGEKLYEELLTSEEGMDMTVHKRIFVAKANGLQGPLIEGVMMEMMKGNLPENQYETECFLQQFLPEFRVASNQLTG